MKFQLSPLRMKKSCKCSHGWYWSPRSFREILSFQKYNISIFIDTELLLVQPKTQNHRNTSIHILGVTYFGWLSNLKRLIFNGLKGLSEQLHDKKHRAALLIYFFWRKDVDEKCICALLNEWNVIEQIGIFKAF